MTDKYNVRSYEQKEFGKPWRRHVKRVFADLIVDISGPVEGRLNNWPAMLQDRVYKEIEMRSNISGKQWQHFNSKCDVNEGVYFIHVVLYADVPLQ